VESETDPQTHQASVDHSHVDHSQRGQHETGGRPVKQRALDMCSLSHLTSSLTLASTAVSRNYDKWLEPCNVGFMPSKPTSRAFRL